MATSVTSAAGRAAAQDSGVLAWLLQWVRGHRQAAAYIVIALGVGAVLFVWNVLSTRSVERTAGVRLERARLAVDSRNYPLAASELAQLLENYAGTRAAEQGTILLAQVRLGQGQNEQAIQLLTKFAPDAGDAYRAQAYGLLGAAYERAADAAEYTFLRAQFLSDAGRAWIAAGDTAKALTAYQAITSKLDSSAAVMEAKVRIGELTRGVGSQ